MQKRHLSEEHKEKLRIAMRAAWARRKAAGPIVFSDEHRARLKAARARRKKLL